MTDRDVMQQALEALESGLAFAADATVLQNLRTALEQPEPPPEWPLIKNILAEYGLDAIAFVAEWKAAQQQAEPVAWMVYTQDGGSVYITDNPTGIQEGQRSLPLYTAPPQRTWVGSTNVKGQSRKTTKGQRQ